MGAKQGKVARGDISDDKYPATPFLLHGVASSDHVHHYLPANIPLFPMLNQTYAEECTKTWRDICKATPDKMKGYDQPGIVLFQDEFFHRLFQRDSAMEGVFSSPKKRAEVLVLAMTFILKTASDDHEKVKHRCRHLGHMHRSIPLVRPHHFAVYVGTCIEVIMHWLGKESTPNVGEAWSNVMGFYLKHIMQAYLFQTVNESDFAQNTTATAGPTTVIDTRNRYEDAFSVPMACLEIARNLQISAMSAVSELRDAYKAIKFLQEALTKSKEEVGMCHSQLMVQEEQHLVDIHTLQAELNQERAKTVQAQPPAACQHHGHGLDALQRQYTNELKKLRDELDNAIHFRQRAEEVAAECQAELNAERQKYSSLGAQLHTLQTSMNTIQDQLDISITDNTSLEARLSHVVSVSNAQQDKIVTLEIALADMSSGLASSQETCATLARDKRRLEEEVVAVRLYQVEEVAAPSPVEAILDLKRESKTVQTEDESSSLPTHGHLGEWKDTLRGLASDLKTIRGDVGAMQAAALPSLDQLYQYTSRPKNPHGAYVNALSAQVRSLREEWHAAKDTWAAISAESLAFVTDQLTTFSIVLSARNAQTRNRQQLAALRVQALRSERDDLKATVMTWQADVEAHVKQVLVAQDRHLQRASRGAEGTERQLMAREDTTSPHFRYVLIPSPSDAISWVTLERRLGQLKTPFHRLMSSLEQANYVLKLLVAFLDAIPAPAFDMNSPEVEHILTSWTSDVMARTAAARWLSAMYFNHPTNESSFRFTGLTREVKDAILVLIVPLLLKAKRQVQVRRKRQPTTDAKWDIAIEASPKRQPQPQSAVFKAIQRRLSELQK
ncbi:hypothetical protein DYB25_002678 [Aphanomyces astaci]|uniref:Globin domain-containing protein n=2 Tax=Aphanomyces astaci TaxID=112090 RepID=A0A397CZK1_APHAT|nr:hypothetical protein DYB36_000244 [Aphanomyces astaci]RHY27330.1 hypothetical protein DYB25_002678 [Aphanomyces astaci]RHY52361.1 hypothetical protein DYB38_005213 [Aphanomyces astaci]RHY54079.1 hypothetical protein DYB34_002180 [Aphanomyces astaci]RHY64287.1 hypothetical protein DYB30_001170 [Aphanomyces astaci]